MKLITEECPNRVDGCLSWGSGDWRVDLVVVVVG